MQVTNKLNLPGPLFRALAHDGYTPGEKPSDISVTSLINSPRIVELKRRHNDELVEDASDRVWTLLGQSIHSVLEKAEDDDCIVERRLYVKIGGWVLSGQTDLFEGTTITPPGEHKPGSKIFKEYNIISDFKVTSIFSFLMGLKEEWVAQLNLNALLWREAGYDVHKAQIVAILKDWQSSKALYDSTYPPCATQIVDIPLWDQKSAIAYASKRIALHKEARESDVPDDGLAPCTPDERWYRNGSWAVMKEGNKKATKVRETKEAAQEEMAALQVAKPKDKYILVERPGENIRCARFCPVRHFCNFYKENVANNIVNDNGDE